MNTKHPTDASLRRIGATLIDFLVLLLLSFISILVFGVIWWICRFYFHAKSGTSIGKRLLKVRLVDSKTFQHPSLFRSVLHDLFSVCLYFSVAISLFGNQIALFIAGVFLLLFVPVLIGSFISMAVDKKLGRTLYDYWSRTAVILASESDNFYPEDPV